MLKIFITLNKTACKKLCDHLPQAKINIFELYEKVVTDYLNLKRDQIIVEGGGDTVPSESTRILHRMRKLLRLISPRNRGVKITM